MIDITFPDGSVRSYEKGITPYQIAEQISPRLAGEVLAASSSHLMAEALELLYPGIKFGIGPSIENGFYYDVDLGDRTITDSDLKKIEDKMIELARQKQHFVRKEVSKAEAMDTYTKKGDEYKCDLIGGLEDGTITFYTNGSFTDLCRGPHLRDTSVIKAVKLTSIAGAYWRGDEHNKMLTRIYGITFPQKKLLDEYIALMEEAKKRDHRKIGKELELFTFSPRVGAGLPLSEGRSRPASVAAQGSRPARASGDVPAQGAEGLRLSARDYPAYRPEGALRDIGPLRQVRSRLIQAYHHSSGRRGVPAQAHELPSPLRDIPQQAPLIQGSAYPSGRVRHGVPL